MWYLINLSTILKEIPIIRGPELVQKLSLPDIIVSFFKKSIRIFSHQFLFFVNSKLMVVLNEVSDLVLFHAFEAFQENCIFDIFENVIVDVFQSFCCFEPLWCVLLVEVAVPDPLTTVDCSFGVGFPLYQLLI